jgi:hypothetical protein
MLRQSISRQLLRRAAPRRVVLPSLAQPATSFHASAVTSADALDMVDTFARRHSKYVVV